MKEYPNLEWFLVGLNLGTLLTLLATIYLTKTDDKSKYKHKKEYAFEEAKNWNNSNLSAREQHFVYPTLQYAKPE